MNKYQDYSDSQLILLSKEQSQEAKDILFAKYHYIIDLTVKKYIVAAKKNGIEYKDLYQEALLGYTDAILKYDDKSSSLPTFISLCVDRRLQVVLRNAKALKNQLLLDSLSLDYTFNEDGVSLLDNLKDKNEEDPLNKLENTENYYELIKNINQILSKREYEVFMLLLKDFNYLEIAKILNIKPKQADNTIQRLRRKIKDLLKANKN